MNIGDDEAMSERLYQVAEYIKGLCDKMKANQDALFGGCKQFGFPASAAPTEIPITAAPLQPFPGRS